MRGVGDAGGGRPMKDLQGQVANATGGPMHVCPNCSSYVIAAIWSERVNERCIRNVWSCDACGYEYETSAYFPAEATQH